MKITDLLDRPIAFHRVFVELTGSVEAALMLSQALYWRKRTQSEDGSFYKSAKDWEEETGLTRNQQERARRILKQHDFWKEELRGVPATLYFFLDLEMLAARLIGDSEISLSPERIIELFKSSLTNLSRTHLMRARNAGQPNAEYVDLSEIVLRDAAVCHICHEPITRGPGYFDDALQFDHLTPLSAGGEHRASNVACAHARCNTEKGDVVREPKEVPLPVPPSKFPQFPYASQTRLSTVDEQDELSAASNNIESETTSETTARAPAERSDEELNQIMETIEEGHAAVDAMLEVQRSAPASKAYLNRSKIPEPMLPLCDVYVELSGQTPNKHNLLDWLGSLQEWLDNQLTPEHIRAAYEYSQGDRGFLVGRPGALTKTAIAMRSKMQPAKRPKSPADVIPDVAKTKELLAQRDQKPTGGRPPTIEEIEEGRRRLQEINARRDAEDKARRLINVTGGKG